MDYGCLFYKLLEKDKFIKYIDLIFDLIPKKSNIKKDPSIIDIEDGLDDINEDLIKNSKEIWA